jgi:hypothetical protein
MSCSPKKVLPDLAEIFDGICGIFVVAERERDLISLRTKAALAAKQPGTRLGAPNPARAGALGVAATRFERL